mmetsp:Transcript_13128/g.18811  ORF Transcript_13128/g.18811 Transcript_13128/m.18811 type:complete len:121 (-) Transcript_13128:103-465(-)
MEHESLVQKEQPLHFSISQKMFGALSLQKEAHCAVDISTLALDFAIFLSSLMPFFLVKRSYKHFFDTQFTRHRRQIERLQFFKLKHFGGHDEGTISLDWTELPSPNAELKRLMDDIDTKI